MSEDPKNQEQNQQQGPNPEEFNMANAQQFFNDYINNIHQQILQYRGMLKQLNGRGKLTGNNPNGEKNKIKKAIATLQNMLTNPQLIQKRVAQSIQQQAMMDQYMKQLSAQQSKEAAPSTEENNQETKTTTKKNSKKPIEEDAKPAETQE